MKSISKYLMSALVVLLAASCQDAENEFAGPQAYPKEDAITVPGFTASSTSAIDLATDAASVDVFNLSDAALPEGFALGTARIVAEPTDVEAEATEIATDVDGMASVADLQALVESTYGKRPVNRAFKAQVYVDAIKDGQAVLIDAGVIDVNLTPKAPQISDAYYIIGEPGAWDPSDITLKFNHSGNDVYGDPVFTITIPVADNDGDGNMWFAISDAIAAEAYSTSGGKDWSKVIGCAEGNGNNTEEGKVARRAEIGNDGSFMIPVDGTAKYIRITLNMMDYSYKIEKLNFAEFIYERGDNNGWGGYALHGPNFDGVYYGAMKLNTMFKFCGDASDWNLAGNWGYSADGILGENSNDNIPCTSGFYMITADIANMTYKLTPFTKIGIIGDGQPGGWNDDTFMTYDETNHCWVATGVALTAGGSIKFRSDAAWDNVNIGGASLDKLVFNSNDNISVTTSGTYTVKLYLENESGQPYATLE
ncbi:MAG: DUF5115 domain-containing protein [Prevotella sp.]